MIDLYYWPTPNGHKITIFLEESGMEYRIKPVNIGAGDQFEPDFLRISPNNKMPAIVDHTASGEPESVFESGAILMYLSELSGQFMPLEMSKRKAVMEWLFWQVGGLGPMLGQQHHFNRYADEELPYAIKRYDDEATRLHRVLNRQLEGNEFVCGEYSIADMAIYPWVRNLDVHKQDPDDIPHLADWIDRMGDRPAVKRAYEIGEDISSDNEMTDEAKKVLFGQTDAARPG